MASTTTIGTTINIQLASITTIKTSFSRVNCCIKHCCTGIKPGNAACTAGLRSQAAVNLQVAVFYVPGIWLHMAPLFTVDIRKFHDTVLLWPSKVDVFWFSWSFSVGCTLCFGHLPLFGRNLPSLKYWYVGIHGPWPLWKAGPYGLFMTFSGLRPRFAIAMSWHHPLWGFLRGARLQSTASTIRGMAWKIRATRGWGIHVGDCGWRLLQEMHRLHRQLRSLKSLKVSRLITKVATDQSPWYPGVKMLSSWCNRMFIRPRLWKILEHHRFSMVFTHPEFAIHTLPESFGLAEVEPTQYSSELDLWRIVTIRAYLWPV